MGIGLLSSHKYASLHIFLNHHYLKHPHHKPSPSSYVYNPTLSPQNLGHKKNYPVVSSLQITVLRKFREGYQIHYNNYCQVKIKKRNNSFHFALQVYTICGDKVPLKVSLKINFCRVENFVNFFYFLFFCSNKTTVWCRTLKYKYIWVKKIG